MISLLVASAAISLAAQSYASSTSPRYLNEAALLPKRGVFKDGVVTLPLMRHRATARAALEKRQSTSQVPTVDVMDKAYVCLEQFKFSTRLTQKLQGVALEIGGQTVAVQVDTGA